MANPYHSSGSLRSRPAGNSDEIQLQIDPIHGNLEIKTEAKAKNDFQARAKSSVRRLSKSIIQSGSNRVLHAILFALSCFFMVYSLPILSRR